MLEKNLENLHESEVHPDTVNQQESEKLEEKEEVKSEISSDEVENGEELPEIVASDEIENEEELPKIISKETVEEDLNPIQDKLTKIDQNLKSAVVDYSLLNMEQLFTELKSMIENSDDAGIKRNMDFIKKEFNKKHSHQLQEEKKIFLEAGNDPINFYFDNPIKPAFDSLYNDYAFKRKKFYTEHDATLKQNLTARIAIIEELKRLIDSGESSTMYRDFKELQQRWNEIGAVPRNNYNDTWRTYQHHVERFYDLLHLNKDLRDLDFRHNLEEKQKIIVKSEELLQNKDVEHAFRELQHLHKIWKELGPVDREHRDEVWEKFSNLTKLIHDKRHEFYKGLKIGFEEQINKKESIIKAIETLDFTKNNSHSDWQKYIAKIEQFRKEFIEITDVPRKKNDELWGKFKEVTRQFNKAKNAFYKDIKQEQQDNLTLKMQLVEKANALKDSEDIEKTAEILKTIQADWKKVGHVPKKYSDKLWKDFKNACNHFFDRYHKLQDEDNQDQLEAFTKKKELYETFKARVEADVELNYEEVQQIIKQWREFGSLPQNLRHIEIKFNKLLDKVFSKIPVDHKTKELLKFKNIMESFLQQKNYRKIDTEQLFIRKKIDDITKENQQLENNINFISNATDNNPLIIRVRGDIEKNIENLAIWKEKIKYLAELKY